MRKLTFYRTDNVCLRRQLKRDRLTALIKKTMKRKGNKKKICKPVHCCNLEIGSLLNSAGRLYSCESTELEKCNTITLSDKSNDNVKFESERLICGPHLVGVLEGGDMRNHCIFQRKYQ